MIPEIKNKLDQEVQPEKIDALRQHLVRNLHRSRSSMARYYPDWDRAIEQYRQLRPKDAEDYRARMKREPEKITVPMSYAQVNTLVTFLYLSYTQKDSIFELTPTGSADYGVIRDACQTVMDRELRQTRYPSKLISALLDMARMNLGVMKTSWKYESFEVEPVVDPVKMLFDLQSGIQSGVMPELEPQPEEVISYEGNYIENISPFQFFYDTRLPLPRWKEGRFAADETAYHFKDLKEMEKEGRICGTEYITPFSKKDWLFREDSNRLLGVDPADQRRGFSKEDYMCVLTTIQMKIVPKEYDLSSSDQQEIWVFGVVNDSRIVSAEPLNAPHREFTYDLLTMSPDLHGELCDSLATLIDPMQEIITWLINARVAAVRQNIEGRLVVDPTFVDTATLTSGNRYIMMKKNTPRLGVDKFISQLKTTDPTVTHLQDANTIMSMLQIITGVNENAMGQVASGRRSATENRAANAGASSRMKLIATTIWTDALASQGRKLLLNCRQDLSPETYEKIVGADVAMPTWAIFHPEQSHVLVANEDFFDYDGTLSSEKGFIAQSLQELISVLASNPQVLAATGLDLVAMIEEVSALRGLKNLQRFRLAPPQAAAQAQVLNPQPPPSNAPGNPAEPATDSIPA